MNDRSIRDRLLEAEKRDPVLEDRFKKEMKKMTEHRLTPSGKVVWAFTTLVAAVLAVFFTYLAITVQDLPRLGRVGFIEGVLFSIAWIILGVRILKKGSFDLLRHDNSINSLVFGFVLLLLVNMLILGSQIEDRTLGNQMIICGAVFFMIFGLPAIINMRVNRMEYTLRQHLLNIELKMAELSERLGMKTD
jgi:cation transport ATPase